MYGASRYTPRPRFGIRARSRVWLKRFPISRQLGVTAVELLPAQEFHENELTVRNPATGERLRNCWGYSTVAFFAPMESYPSRLRPGIQVSEFRTMVRALHRAGIEVILDIVFNHTAEGGHDGPNPRHDCVAPAASTAARGSILCAG